MSGEKEFGVLAARAFRSDAGDWIVPNENPVRLTRLAGAVARGTVNLTSGLCHIFEPVKKIQNAGVSE